MERGAFQTERFEEVLGRYVEARLHNDKRDGSKLTEESIRIQGLQDELVGHRGLPQYLVMDPASREVMAVHSLTPGGYEDALLEFLQQGVTWFEQGGNAP